MDPQQIRNIRTLADEVASPPYELIATGALLAEYADLLEASERVWWCEDCKDEEDRTVTRGLHFDKPSRDHSEGCGWRRLTPERTS